MTNNATENGDVERTLRARIQLIDAIAELNQKKRTETKRVEQAIDAALAANPFNPVTVSKLGKDLKVLLDGFEADISAYEKAEALADRKIKAFTKTEPETLKSALDIFIPDLEKDSDINEENQRTLKRVLGGFKDMQAELEKAELAKQKERKKFEEFPERLLTAIGRLPDSATKK